MLAFFISFCITWYSSGDRVVVVLISVACGLVAVLIVWGAAIKYEKEPYWGFSPKWARNGWHAIRERARAREEALKLRRQSMMSVGSNGSHLDDEKAEKG